METKNNPVGWFEIPVTDMERAVRFYETVFNVKLERMPMGDLDMAMFAHSDGIGSGGALVKHDRYYKPSTDGVLIYFTTAYGDAAKDLEKVTQAGGNVIQPKTLISEDIGYMGMFIDTEGNRIAVHSRT